MKEVFMKIHFSYSKNNLRLQGTFLTVDQLVSGQWSTVRTDSHPSTIYNWTRVSTVRRIFTAFKALIYHVFFLLLFNRYLGLAQSLFLGEIQDLVFWSSGLIYFFARTIESDTPGTG